MDIFLSLAFTIIFSYLFGSLNSAIIVCRVLKHKDIRDYGSNNAGLTNVLRVFGKGPAAATLLCDLAKGVLAVVICRLVVTNGFGVTFFHDDKFIGYLAGFFVMLGHIFPVFYGFHGGKGVLIAATTLIAIDPLTCAFSVAVFAIVLAATYAPLSHILFLRLSFSFLSSRATAFLQILLWQRLSVCLSFICTDLISNAL